MIERILIAEDDADMRELLEKILTDAGFDSQIAPETLALLTAYYGF